MRHLLPISNRSEPPAMVEAALRCLMTAFDALGVSVRAWVMVFDPGRDGWVPLAGAGRDAGLMAPDALSLPAPLDILSGRLPGAADADWGPWREALGARSLLVAPAMLGTQVRGLLAVASSAPGAFSESHAALVRAHAALLATALDEVTGKRGRDRRHDQLGDLVERLPDGVVLLDESGAIARMNVAARAAFGVSELPPGTRLSHLERGVSVQHADGRPVSPDRLPSARLARGEAFDEVDMVVTAPGRLSQAYRISGIQLKDARGAVTGAACLFQDRGALWQRELELSVLYALTNAAIETRPLDQLLARALGHILGLTHLGSGLMLYHTADQDAPLLSHRGLPEELVRAATAFEAAYGLERLYRCLAEPEPSGECEPEQRLRARFSQALYSWVALPLHRDEHLSGLLFLGSADYSQLSDDLSQVLVTITNQLLIAIERSQAMAEMERLVASRTRELTESHRQLEETIAELRRMDQFKSNFLSNVSHELRTPLSGIIGYGEFLAEGVYGDLSPEQQAVLEQLVRNSYALMELINNLLDLSRIDAGRLKLYKEPIDLGTLFEQSVGQVVPQAMQKQIKLEVPPAADVTVEVDPGRIVQVLVNLVGNAIKFTPEHGTIRVAYHRAEHEVTVSVSDTGIGIPPEHLPQLFVRFSQVDGSHTRQFSGTGLGLAICRELIELHQQRIWVESAPGRGSTFYFTLPVWQPAPEPVIKKG